ncbi:MULTISPECIES: hypothetical protein [Fischerella]|nr:MULTISPECIES: hypothetical protein [Fischerella]
MGYLWVLMGLYVGVDLWLCQILGLDYLTQMHTDEHGWLIRGY